ncbi:MAG: hypothetical protein QOE14_2388 [Humisphaera sp.]|nr:hypothetical protein [Humisphaera sp.]
MSVRRFDLAHVVDSLEARRLFAAAPLAVNGTAGNDIIQISLSGSNYVVIVNGSSAQHAVANVSAINVFAGDGDDIVVAAPGFALGFYTDGGNGNDRVVGGDGPDTFLGAAGKDQLYGGSGNDRINGAGGNDKVIGDAGADRLYGGAGNDYIDGGSSGDRIYPGAGFDSCFGSSGNDFFFSFDKVIDQIYGGSGTDVATADSIDIRGSIEQMALI